MPFYLSLAFTFLEWTCTLYWHWTCLTILSPLILVSLVSRFWSCSSCLYLGYYFFSVSPHCFSWVYISVWLFLFPYVVMKKLPSDLTGISPQMPCLLALVIVHLGDRKPPSYSYAGEQTLAPMFSALLMVLTWNPVYPRPECFDEHVGYSNTRVLSIDNFQTFCCNLSYTQH